MQLGTMTDNKAETETANMLRLRRDAGHAQEHQLRRLITRPPMQRKPCWSDQDKTDMIDTCVRGWICSPIYIIPHPDRIDVCEYGEDHVFDGAHKLEAVFDFIEGKYALKYSADSLQTAYLKEYNGKRYDELPRATQDAIRRYRFNINIVDAETAADPDMLRVLWERVNRSGKRLNKFELEIPLIAPLLDQVLTPALPLFTGTVLFPREESFRGSLEHVLQVILALGDIPDAQFASQMALIQAWHRTCLGATMAKRVASVTENADRWKAALHQAHKMMEELVQLNVFSSGDAVDIADAQRKTELPFVLGKLLRRFPRIEEFRSQKVAIAAKLRAELFGRTPVQMLQHLDADARNGTFQKKLLRYIDGVVLNLAGAVQPRLFTKAQKAAKLKEQGGICVGCGEKILKHQIADGDHVVAWSEGGETTAENLQILHRHCHQQKTGGA
jgi:hypothetical protein